MPYRTFDDRIDGLVITFINISGLKQVEEKLNETEQINNLLLNLSSDIIIKLSANLELLEFNSAAEKYFGMKRKDVLNQNFIELFIPVALRKKTGKELKKLMEQAKKNIINMHLIVAEGIEVDSKWSVNVLFNKLQIPTEMIVTKKAED
jgi:two-component system CheB/CheR fusion protein